MCIYMLQSRYLSTITVVQKQYKTEQTSAAHTKYSIVIIIVYFPKNYTWYVHYKHKNTSHTSHAHVTEEWLCNGWEGCQKKLAFIELAA